jgi:glucokinase
VQQENVIGIDIGGTAIKLGRFTQDGTCTQSLTVATPQPAIPEAVIGAVAQAVTQLRTPDTIALGVGTPGPADAAGRVAKVAINLQGWIDIPLADELEAKTSLPCVIANDANCAGLGEAWLGAGSQFTNLILLTLGTGVGGAIILDNQLFVGHNGAAGELGLITLYPDGYPCNSGNNGSMEQYLSINGIKRQTGKDPAELSALAQGGDSEALQFWQGYGRMLGAGLASLIYVLTPEAIILGGGVSASYEFFLPAAEAEIQRRVLASSRINLQLLPAQLGNRAGMVGAAKLAWDL